jgi:hypothetical protein
LVIAIIGAHVENGVIILEKQSSDIPPILLELFSKSMLENTIITVPWVTKKISIYPKVSCTEKYID